MKVKTTYYNGRWKWRAQTNFLSSWSGVYGFGNTEKAAIDDLKQKIQELKDNPGGTYEVEV